MGFSYQLKKKWSKKPIFRASTEQHLSYQDLEAPVSAISVIIGCISFGKKCRMDCGGGVYFEDQLRAILKI